MKKVLFFICTIAFISCSKEEDSSSTATIDKDEANFTISEPQELITEESPYSRIKLQEDNQTALLPITNNLQVGQTLKFNINIKNFDKDPNVVYVLKPVTLDATKHQKNRVDYSFSERVQAHNFAFLSVQDSIIFSKKIVENTLQTNPKPAFYLNFLKPGTFLLQFELRKMKNNKYVSEAVRQDLPIYNFVKIEAYTWAEQTRSAGTGHHSEHTRYYKLTINDGEQDHDNYLENTESKTHTYSAIYKNQTTNDILDIKTNNEIRFSQDVQTSKGAETVTSWNLSELKILQKNNNNTTNIIIYNNLIIKEKKL